MLARNLLTPVSCVDRVTPASTAHGVSGLCDNNSASNTGLTSSALAPLPVDERQLVGIAWLRLEIGEDRCRHPQRRSAQEVGNRYDLNLGIRLPSERRRVIPRLPGLIAHASCRLAKCDQDSHFGAL